MHQPSISHDSNCSFVASRDGDDFFQLTDATYCTGTTAGCFISSGASEMSEIDSIRHSRSSATKSRTLPLIAVPEEKQRLSVELLQQSLYHCENHPARTHDVEGNYRKISPRDICPSWRLENLIFRLKRLIRKLFCRPQRHFPFAFVN
jgi:hypothetical protein